MIEQVEPRAYDLDAQWKPIRVSEREVSSIVARKVETMDAIVDDLSEQRFGRHDVSERERHSAQQEISDEVRETSNWFYFPWDSVAVRYPSKHDHLNLRTWRNRDLNTVDEQHKLYNSKLAVFGLSVGSNIVEQLTQSGISNNQIKGDSDTISVPNLNRIRATMSDVGLAKTVWLARKVAKFDPYIKQTQLNGGYEGRLTDSLLAEQRPDIIFDEVDNLAVKAMLRRVGKELNIPIVQVGDIDERSIVDVERYDIDTNTEPFNGRLSASIYEDLIVDGIKDPSKVIPLLVELNGQENISPRLYQSALNLDLGGLPQRGATAAAGAAFADRIARGILLGHDIPSGRYILNPDDLILK